MTISTPVLVAMLACSGGDKSEETAEPLTCSAEDLDQTYSRYVEPFVSGAVQSSCTECHMSGVDISMYAQDTPCQTLACMVDAGVADLENPSESSLLDLIRMGQTASSVFDVEDEADAFLAWFEWSAVCHEEACGELESPCSSGTGAASTGINPIGDCSEQDLLASFWDAVIIDRGRCNVCHSQWAEDNGTYNACSSDADCEAQLTCLAGYCKKEGPFYAPHFFEGLENGASWNNDEHKQEALHTMYNSAAMGILDVDVPLNSRLLTKPLLEDFQPVAIYGPGVSIDAVPEGEGEGISHLGLSKFNFGCLTDPPCPSSGIVDCRKEQACHGDGDCAADKFCDLEEEETTGWCRLTGSLCDETYTAYVQFVEYFASCK